MLAAVTGTFGYTGAHLARALIARGVRVRALTNRAPEGDLAGAVEVAPLRFDDPDALDRALRGADGLYNTYWVRFPYHGATFEQAVANSTTLFGAAKRAGVRRIVHISVSNADRSPLPYYRGKAEVERALAASGVPYAIVRPTLLFG